MSQKKAYQLTIDAAEGKLDRVMDRLGVERYDYDYSETRSGKSCWVELVCKGRAYRFENSTLKSAQSGRCLIYMSDLFAELVYALEDLARAVEKGIFTLDMLLEGKLALPEATTAEPCFQALGFSSRPESTEAVKERYRKLAKTMHPDGGGDTEAFMTLERNYKQCVEIMEEVG